MIPKNIKGFLFDFDGVIAKTMDDNFNAWKSSMEEFGVEIKKEDYFLLEGMSLVEIAKKFCKDNNLDISYFKGIVDKKERYYIENHHFELYSGVEEFIDKLKSISILTGIVTAASYERLSKSVPKEFLEKFDTIVTGDKTNKGKPYPDPYLKGLSDLNLMANGCIVIENAPMGIKSAKKAGIYCIAICSTLDKAYLQEADEIIDEFKNINKLEVIKLIINN